MFFFIKIHKSSVKEPEYYVGIPDSCWLTSYVYHDKLRKDIAWSALKNRDWELLFKEDTAKSVLLDIFKSPSDFSLLPDQPVVLFSTYRYQQSIQGILFRLTSGKTVAQALMGGTASPGPDMTGYTRTKEGVWMYDEHNLLLILENDKDSLAASDIFSTRNTLEAAEADYSSETYLTGHLNMTYYPLQAYSFLQDYNIHFSLQCSDGKLNIISTGTGALNTLFENRILYSPANTPGLFYSGSMHKKKLRDILATIPALDTVYKKNPDLYGAILTTLDNTTFAEWNGWNTVKQSYYLSEMNDEFEVVLVKKDSSFQEPVFRVQVNQANKDDRLVLINALQKAGLISDAVKQRYKVIPGNFDSEIFFLKDSIICLQTKHSVFLPLKNNGSEKSFMAGLHPSAIQQWTLQKPGSYPILDKLDSLNSIDDIIITGIKNKDALQIECTVSFTGKEHPFLQLMKAASALR